MWRINSSCDCPNWRQSWVNKGKSFEIFTLKILWNYTMHVYLAQFFRQRSISSHWRVVWQMNNAWSEGRQVYLNNSIRVEKSVQQSKKVKQEAKQCTCRHSGTCSSKLNTKQREIEMTAVVQVWYRRNKSGFHIEQNLNN